MDRFTPYGVSHRVVIVLLLVGAAALISLGRARPDGAPARRDGRALAMAILAVTVPLQLVALERTDWDVERSLPLQLCDLASLVAPYALWTRRPWAVAVTYYWGLTLTTQAVLTPDLASDFPNPVFLLFWGMHLMVVWAACYLTWGNGLVPAWSGYRTAVAVTLTWVLVVFGVNALLGSNYGYLNAKPPSASVLDYLGDWPLYVVAEAAIILTVWALLTWPWVDGARHAAHQPGSAGE